MECVLWYVKYDPTNNSNLNENVRFIMFHILIDNIIELYQVFYNLLILIGASNKLNIQLSDYILEFNSRVDLSMF